MSDNGTPESFDAQPVADQIPDAEWAAFSSGQSRRKFLRNALIGSAAAAAVVGTTTTLLVTTAGASPDSVHPKITGRLNASRSQLSPLDPSALCFEDTNLTGSLPCGPTNGSFWLFFTIKSVAVGTGYTAEVTQSTDSGTTQSDFTQSSTPFALQSTKSAVHVTGGGSPANCPTSKPAGTTYDADPVMFDVTGSTQDVQVAIHLTWNGGTVSGTETITFNATLKDSTNELVAQPASITFVTPCPKP